MSEATGRAAVRVAAAALVLTLAGAPVHGRGGAPANPAAALLGQVPLEERVVPGEPHPYRHTVTVFTDTECAFCRKVHLDLSGYRQLGIRIEYVLYPRAGPDSEAFRRAVSVWCAEDRGVALDRAFAGQTLPPADCRNPVRRHYELAKAMKLLGTPAFVAADGTILYGAFPPGALLGRLQALESLGGG